MIPELRCLLFDLDGTLVDTDRLHLQAYNLVLGKFDRTVSVDFYRRHIMGFSDVEILSALFPHHRDGEFDHVIETKEATFRTLISELSPTPGASEVIDWGRARGLRQAIVTNAPRENADRLLRAIGLRERFETVIVGSELPRGKPDPLPYLTALKCLQCDAEHSIAFEDSLSGVRAAAAAGIFTVGIETSLGPDLLLKEGASLVIKDFRDAALRTLIGIQEPICQRIFDSSSAS
jgi:HAD superfamily hydrolase (TIGR01509 family)